MGFNFLIPSVVPPTVQEEEVTIQKTEDSLYFIRSSQVTATMKETDNGYIVLRGSEAKDTTSKAFDQYLKKRKKLIENSTLTDKNSKLIFTEDAIFNSVSAAASIVLGRHANGNIEWADEQGQTYRVVQESKNE